MTNDLTEIVHAWIREDLDVGAKLSIGYYGPALIERLKPIQELIQRLEGERDEARAIARRVPELEFELKAKVYETEIADGEIERLRAALEDVLNPMRVLERRAEAEGNRLNGTAYSIANDLGFVKSIARSALQTGGKEHG